MGTVKARMQEHGMERRTEVMWFHTGDYTEKFDTKSRSDDQR